MELNALLLIGMLLLLLYLDNWGAGGVTSTERRVALKLLTVCHDHVYSIVRLALELQHQRIEPYDVDRENGREAMHAIADTIRIPDLFHRYGMHEVDTYPEFEQLDYAWKRVVRATGDVKTRRIRQASTGRA